jgi:Tol biopolymer transport system component
VLYELSTGRHPFAAEGVLETLRAIGSADPVPPSAVLPEIPKALDALIRKMLAKSKEARPSAAEAAERLEEILQTAPASSKKWLVAAVLTLTVAVLALVWNFRRSGNPIPVAPVPLTAQAGWEFSPQISPDGHSIVYAWGPSPEQPTHIYVARLDQQAPLMVVNAAAGEKVGVPVWSRDGNRVIYKREYSNGRGAIWSVSVDRKDNRVLKDLSRGDISSGLSLSPDGNTLLYSDSRVVPEDRFSLWSLDLRMKTVQTLTSPPSDYWGDWDPKFSRDGETIAFKRVRNFWHDYIYTMPAKGGPARRLTHEEQISIHGHTWMPGGDLLLSCQLGGIVHGLWRIPVNRSGDAQPLLVTGLNTVTPTVSADGSRIAWASRINDHNIYSIPISGRKAVEDRSVNRI